MSKDLTQNFISLHNIGTATLYESKSINMLSNKVSTIKQDITFEMRNLPQEDR